MNITSFGHKFFIFSGILLIAIAGVQVLSRPRSKGGTWAGLRLDATTIQAIFFVAFGVFALLAGTGVIPMTPGQ